MIKCVVWDLDNTIWEGIISEEETVKVRTEVIGIIKELNQKGIVNTICSRNDFGVIKQKLEELHLWKLFVYPQINWSDKTVNIRNFIQKFHFKIEDIAFVDDNPFERELVKKNLGEISVVDGNDIKSIQNILGNIDENVSFFEAQNRVQLYKIEERRIRDNESFQGTDLEFLKECNITVTIRRAKQLDLERISGLIERTNQLNTMGKFYDKNKVVDLIQKENYDVLVANVFDKYGEYGDAGLLIAENRGASYKIELLVVSCRLLGKGLPQTLLAYSHRRAIMNKCSQLECDFTKTKYNRQMRILFAMNGMQVEPSTDSRCKYTMKCDKRNIEYPAWIHFIEKSDMTK